MCEIPAARLETRLLEEVRRQGGLAALAAYDAIRAEGACLNHFCDAVRSLARRGLLSSSDPSQPVTASLGAVRILDLGLEAAPEPAAPAGPRIRRFSDRVSVDLARPLGRGSAGAVYRGEDLRTGSPLAVKVFSLKARLPEEVRSWYLERFRQEPRLLSQLDHPHIVKVIAFGESDEGPWYAMEFLEGGTLADRIRDGGRLPAKEVRSFFRAVADALAETTRRGILHRDIKPANIFNRGIKLADFGVAKVPAASAESGAIRSITEAGSMVGTLPYVAPERLEYAAADVRSEIFSAGATMYHAATGALLFDVPAGDRRGWRECHLYAEPVPVEKRVPGFPGPLARIIARCLSKSPEDRYPSFEAILKDLLIS